MKTEITYFTKDDGKLLPVNVAKYLLPILNPTSAGTNYWDLPKAGRLSDKQRARILLQVHQILDIFKSLGVNLEDKRLLDIGTGNGIVPRLLLEFSDLREAVGADAFLDGEHKTSWQSHDQNMEFADLRSFIERDGFLTLDFENYKEKTKNESLSFLPRPINITKRSSKPYKFAQIGAHDLEKLNQEFDIFYCKAIEHISNWEGVFSSVKRASGVGAILYLKHRPFFSYLGAHRYGSIGIPWGHVLLTDQEFRRFTKEFHPERELEICDFFFHGLAYPRNSVTDMLRIAEENGFSPIGIQIEPPRYLKTVVPFLKEIDTFWDIVWQNYPRVSAEELFSGIYHIVLQRNN